MKPYVVRREQINPWMVKIHLSDGQTYFMKNGKIMPVIAHKMEKDA